MKYFITYSFLIALGLLAPFSVHAQENSLSLSITPPLVELSIGPGEFWASSLKVLNPNDFPLTVYGSVVDFRATGTDGRGVFVPGSAARENSLSSWTSVQEEPVDIAPGGSADLNFEVRIPEIADAGGHYAAILVGTRPVEDEDSGSHISVSSFVSSLLFVRIEGDVHEDGFITSFHSEKEWLNEPETNFTLSFKNTGNVHVRPVGEIAIETIRGREIVKLPFNDSDNYGSVLPEGVRIFETPWSWTDARWYNIGRYRAVATVAFGHDARHNVTATTTFWYVPTKPLFFGVGSVIALVLLVVLITRIYMRQALKQLTRRRFPQGHRRRKRAMSVSDFPQKRKNMEKAPRRAARPKSTQKGGILDLRKRK